MRSVSWVALGLALFVLAGLTWGADSGHVREQIERRRIVPGLSFRDVRAALGEPTKITKTRTYWETKEDWVYGEGVDAVSLTFQEGKLQRITDGLRSAPR
ncbi:MAG: hypothetical protein HY713_03165 [candidate division NC10 bacterium]|nr:hypothetical protein [candidate division NC10 bacterium]